MGFDSSLFLAQTAKPNSALQFVDNLARTPLSQVLIFIVACTVLRSLLYPIIMKTPPFKRTGFFSAFKFANEGLDALVYAGGIVFLLIRPFVLQTFFIPSESMEKTLLIGDFIVANKFIYRVSEPQSGDIVVFRPPARGLLPGSGQTDYIKRLIGTPGQVIEIRNGKLFRNGVKQNEVYTVNGDAEYDFKLVNDKGNFIPLLINPMTGLVNSEMTCEDYHVEPDDTERQRYLMSLPPAAIPAGKFLMMGDNRNRSFDGRAWGLVDRRNLIGRSEFIFIPFPRVRITR